MMPDRFEVEGRSEVEEAPPDRYEEVPYRESESAPPRTVRVASEYWKRIDDLYYDTIDRAKKAFKVNVQINIVIVVVGIGLIVNSMAYSWVKGQDALSVVSAALGVADFVLIFWVNPQKNIHKTLGNLLQVQVAYRTYLSQLETVLDYERQRYRSKEMTYDDVEKINKNLESISSKAISTIEDYVEKNG